MSEDTFFSQRNCDRCGAVLNLRTMSFFTEETICSDCSEKEAKIRNRIEEEEGPRASLKYEGCGYVPGKGRASEK